MKINPLPQNNVSSLPVVLAASGWIYLSNLGIETKSDRVDIGVRVELSADTFSELTDSLYESKIVYRSKKYQDRVRTFCMNLKVLSLTKIQMVSLQ